VFFKSVCFYTINFAVIPEKTMITLLTAWFVAVCCGMDEIISRENGSAHYIAKTQSESSMKSEKLWFDSRTDKVYIMYCWAH
jgi:hypothetical protein